MWQWPDAEAEMLAAAAANAADETLTRYRRTRYKSSRPYCQRPN